MQVFYLINTLFAKSEQRTLLNDVGLKMYFIIVLSANRGKQLDQGVDSDEKRNGCCSNDGVASSGSEPIATPTGLTGSSMRCYGEKEESQGVKLFGSTPNVDSRILQT